MRMAMAQWRARARRTLALLSMIAVAVAGFTLLTGAAVTSRLHAVGTVESNYRPAYDILVRPGDAVLPQERERNLVQSGQLAGLRGGIGTAQWRQIQQIPGVAVAAPVAVIGYVMRTVPVQVDLAGVLDPAAERQVFRVRPTWVTDAGLSRIPDGATYLYATRNRIDVTAHSDLGPGERPTPPAEVDRDGRRHPVCPGVPVVKPGEWIDPTDLRGRSSLTCTGGRGSTDAAGKPTAPRVTLLWSIPFLVAAVDPAAEAALAGLGAAVTDGRYFQPAEKPATGQLPDTPYPYAMLPVLIADKPQLDTTLQVDIEAMDPAATDLVRRPRPDDRALRAELNRRPGTAVERRTVAIDQPYRELVGRMRHPSTAGPSFDGADGWGDTLWLSRFWTVGPVVTDPSADGLRARAVTHDRMIWGQGADGGTVSEVPREFADTGVRGSVGAHHNTATQMPDVALNAIGTFDPQRIALGGALSAVPMDTYYQPGAPGADAASRSALGGRKLEPNANVTGLLSQPPLMLTTMDAAAKILGPDRYRTDPPYPEVQLNRSAPISMVRVRLDGEVGLDATSRERVRLVAEQIAARTGLAVDITLGSSPTAVPVHYPAGQFGRPALTVGEPWVRKGVAAVLIEAADRKSVLLSGLVLAVCALAVLNAGRAAIRSRRTELGILACIGWTRRQLVTLLGVELALIGVAAGIAGTLLAVPLSLAFGLTLSWPQLLLTVPAAVLLVLVAGGGPAWRAARPDPAALVRPAVSMTATGHWSPGRITGLALLNLARTPGRTLLGATSLLLGVAALTLLLAITFAFRGAVTGTLLGEAVTLQARTVDYLAVAVTIVLGVVSVADVLYLNVLERAGQFALLTAVGWPDRALHRLVLTEALGMGLLGGLAGAGLGLAGAALFAGAVTGALLWCAGAALGAGVLLAAASVVGPVVMLRRLPTAGLLAQE